MHNLHLLAYYGEIEKGGISTMLGVTFFSQYLFAVMAGLIIGMSIGGGSLNLSTSRRLKPIFQQAWGQHVPRYIARSMAVARCLSSVVLAFGVLAFFALLAGNVSVTGMILNWWAVVFIATCGLVTLSAYITVFMARKRREHLLRLEGRGMEGQEQSVRSRHLPVPKEAREEEQGPLER
jgi:hypothetical protein